MITIAVECAARASPKLLIDRIWLGLEWKSTASGIKALAVEYDDGLHQSVQVCVDDWKLRYLAMSIVRFRDNDSRISFFYSRLPHGIAIQTGIWEARAHEAGSCLRPVRSLQLRRGKGESDLTFHRREEEFGLMLRERLGLVLDMVTQYDEDLSSTLVS